MHLKMIMSWQRDIFASMSFDPFAWKKCELVQNHCQSSVLVGSMKSREVSCCSLVLNGLKLFEGRATSICFARMLLNTLPLTVFQFICVAVFGSSIDSSKHQSGTTSSVASAFGSQLWQGRKNSLNGISRVLWEFLPSTPGFNRLPDILNGTL